MKALVEGNARQQKVGGFAALYLAAAFIVAMPYFLVFVKYPSVADPAQKVALLVRHHDSMRVMYLITYVIFGLVLAVLALSLHARLKHRAPTLIQAATAVGWREKLLARAMKRSASHWAGARVAASRARAKRPILSIRAAMRMGALSRLAISAG